MIAETSLLAYDPKGMTPLREQVYARIAECNMLSIRDLAIILGRDTSTISARINELAKDGRIRDWAKKTDERTGKTVCVYEVVV